MNWRNNYPIQSDYETEEEYLEALNSYQDALEAYYDEARYREDD